MKMGFLLKNNARKRMGEKGALKKGEEKECSKRERKRSAQKRREKGVLKKGEEKEAEKRPPKFANSKTDGRLGGNSQILKAGEVLFKNFWTGPDVLIMSINRNNREWSLKIHIFYFHNPSCRCNAPARCSPPESRHGAEDCRPKSGRTLSA